MNRPLVSLLMLGYQSVQFVKYAIDSVKAQSYTNWELVFVDDCSTDGTYELVSKLAESDTRIKVYRNEKNLGIVKNRKRAYELSTGDLICHFDNDDMLERWALEEMVYEFARLPEVMLIYTDLAQIDSDSNIELYSASKNYDVNQLHQHGWKHLGMYRREVMKHIEGYNDKLISACEDGDLFMQIAEKFPISRYPKVLYYYRNHGKNNVHNNKKCPTCEERMVCNFIRVWCKSAKYDIVTHKPLEVIA